MGGPRRIKKRNRGVRCTTPKSAERQRGYLLLWRLSTTNRSLWSALAPCGRRNQQARCSRSHCLLSKRILLHKSRAVRYDCCMKCPSHLPLSALLLVLGASIGHSEPHGEFATWREVFPQSLDVVAEKGRIAPIPFPAPFTNFRYPHVDETESVTCIADDPVKFGSGKGGVAHGVYRFHPDGSSRAFHIVPSTPTTPGRFADYIRALQTDGKRFVFRLCYPGEDASNTIALLDGDGTEFIVDTPYTTLENGKRMRFAGDPDISGDYVMFPTSEVGSRGSAIAVMRLGRGGHPPRIVVRAGQPVPGRQDRLFAEFGVMNWLDGSHLIFCCSPTAGCKSTDAHPPSTRCPAIPCWTMVLRS